MNKEFRGSRKHVLDLVSVDDVASALTRNGATVGDITHAQGAENTRLAQRARRFSQRPWRGTTFNVALALRLPDGCRRRSAGAGGRRQRQLDRVLLGCAWS